MASKLIIFDFDGTIMKTYTESVESSHLSDLFKSHYFLDHLRNRIKADLIKCVIVSYNRARLIEAVLKFYGLMDIFSRIYTPADFGLAENMDCREELDGKNVIIDHIHRTKNYAKENIVLIDDSTYNINRAGAYGVKTLLALGNGLYTWQLNSIVKFYN